MSYDVRPLVRLGREHRKRREALDEVREQLAEEIRKAVAAGESQTEVADMAGYTREVVRQLCMSPEQREAEREARRRRTRKPKDE